MASQLRLRRGSTAAHSTFTGAQSEVSVDTDKKTAVVHDGATPGGFPLAREDLTNTNINRRFSQQDDMNFDLSWLITKDGNKVVITGDSLSFNVYDFPGGSPTNEATSCLSGIMSWSFMLRDFIHRADPWFIHADCLDYITANGGEVTTFSMADDYLVPFNDRYVSLGGGASSEIYFLMQAQNEQTGKIVLHCFNNQNGDDGKIDVHYSLYPYSASTLAGTITSGGRTKYQNFEPFTFDIPCGGSSNYPVKIIFTNFRNNDGSAPSSKRRFFMSAAATKNTPVYLTGHGSWQASDIYADFTSRIGQYSPDLLIMILGANDRYYSTKENYAANLVNIINATKALKPYCKIIVLPSLRASDYGYGPTEVRNGSTMLDFLDHAKAAVLNAGGLWFDAYTFTAGLDPAVWRYDNVHMTKRGNKMLFDALIGRYFAAAPSDKKYYDPMLQAGAVTPGFFNDGPGPIHGNVYFTYDNNTQNYIISGGQDQLKAVKSITRVNAYTLKVKFNYRISSTFANNVRISIPVLMHQGRSTYFIQPRLSTYSADSVDFFLFEVLGNELVNDVQNNGQSYSLIF